MEEVEREEREGRKNMDAEREFFKKKLSKKHREDNNERDYEI